MQGDNMNIKEARKIAAQAWTKRETSGIEMDTRLAEAFAKILRGEVNKILKARKKK